MNMEVFDPPTRDIISGRFWVCNIDLTLDEDGIEGEINIDDYRPYDSQRVGYKKGVEISANFDNPFSSKGAVALANALVIASRWADEYATKEPPK